MVKALAIDVGSTTVRAAIVSSRGDVTDVHHERLTVRSPSSGEVELDADEIARLALSVASRSLADGGPVDAVGITNQRATSILFDPDTSRAVGPALSWQDLRTVIDCLVLQGDGLRLAPNQSATKVRWLLQHADQETSSLRCATIETWIAWHLSEGALFISDTSNAAVTGLVNQQLTDWDDETLAALEIPRSALATIVHTSGHFGHASALVGSPPLTALMGDQSASLIGQSCINRGAKITFGTGAMLDLISGERTPTTMQRLDSGCYPIVTRSVPGAITWGIEGIILSAGSCIEWLIDLGLLDTASASSDLASSVESTDGVWFVPALSGLGTPQWDFGARGAFFGLTRGSSRAHVVRAVLEGIAHRGADLIDAAQEEIGEPITEVRIDGGMSANSFFTQHLADVSGRTVSISDEREATTRGIGLMALVGAGMLALEDIEALWSPSKVVRPAIDESERQQRRSTWRSMTQRAAATIPELSTISF